MSLEFILLYSATIFVATVTPGPTMLLALSHGMRYGTRKSLFSATGNLAVTLVQASVSMAGLGTILLASETAFQVLKLAGAAYLVFLGVSIFRAKAAVPMRDSVSREGATSSGKLFLQSALVTAGNPKAIVFFTAVFPQFIDTDSGYMRQILVMFGVGSVIAFGCFMLYVAGGRKMSALLSSKRLAGRFNKIIGLVFAGSGIALATTND